MGGLLDVNYTAVTLHDENLTAKPTLAQFAFQPLQIPAQTRSDISVDERRAKPFEFSDLWKHFRRQRHIYVGQSLADNLAGAQFVHRVEEREEVAHGNRFNLHGGQALHSRPYFLLG